jgi:hypothetical protein
MADELLLPCPVEGCAGAVLRDGQIAECGSNVLWREDRSCNYVNGSWRLPERAVDPDVGAVWVEWLDGVIDRADIAMEFAEHMEREKGWELRFDAIVTMRAERKDGENWWHEIDVPQQLPEGVTPLHKRPPSPRPGEDVRQFWKFVYWRAT